MSFINNKFQNSIEKLTENFLSKIYFGEISVKFPSGKSIFFKGKFKGYSANIKINNYKFISKIIKRMKLPMNLSEIGVDRSMIISALNDSLEKGLKKDRYTILNEINQIKMETIFENTLNQLVSEKILTY